LTPRRLAASAALSSSLAGSGMRLASIVDRMINVDDTDADGQPGTIRNCFVWSRQCQPFTSST
jgi:hypothetical protein